MPARTDLPQPLRTNGLSIPRLGLGTWPLKGESCVETVSHALRLGYPMIDTAAIYDNEREVGEGIRASGIAREGVFVTTKVWYTDLAPGDVQRSAEASLKRLGLNEVDLLLIHWPNPKIPLAQTLLALNDCLARGLTRSIGISNFPAALIDEAVELSEAPLVANQCEYHPNLDQDAVLSVCRARNIAFVSYSPLGKGNLSEAPPIKAAAAAHGKTPSQVILRWHLQQPGVAAIPKSSNRQRVAENIDIFDFELGADEMRAISALGSRAGRMVNPGWAPDWD